MSDDEDTAKRSRLEESAVRRLARFVGLETAEELRGVELPGLGEFCAVTLELEAGGLIVWFNDKHNSTRIVPWVEAVQRVKHYAKGDGPAEVRRATTRASASLDGDNLRVETSAESEGLMQAISESFAEKGERRVNSRSEARPVAETVQGSGEDE